MQTWTDLGIDVPSGHVGEYVTTCPQCSKSRKKKKVKCLSANADEGLYCCHHCGWSGSLKEGVRQAPALRQKPWVPPTPAMTPLSPQQIEWFNDRGISQETLDTFKVFGGKAYFADLEEEREAVRFPYYMDGTLYSVKSRTTDKHFTRTPGGRKTLFGMDNVSGGVLLWCEGEADVLALHEAGVSAVSVPDGAPAPNTKNIAMDYLEECQTFIAKFKTHILAVDNDEPGKRLEKELSRRLGIDRCKRVTWPEGCKDANDVLVAHGPAKLRECIDGAEEYPVVGVFGVNDIKEEMYDEYVNGETPGLHIGFDNMRGMWSVRAGEFTVVTGIPHSGKSGFVTHIAHNMAQLHGWNSAIFPAEAGTLARYANSIIEIHSGKSLRKGVDCRINDREYLEGMAFVNKYFRFVMPGEDEATVSGLLERAKSAVLRWGVKMVVLDPFTEIIDGSSLENGQVSSAHMGKQLSRIKTFANNYGVHLILVVHPRNLLPSPKTGKIERPNGYSLYGGSHFYNKCDNMLIVHREDLSQNVAEVFVQKVRFRIVGKAGESAYFSYNRMNGRFTPTEVV